MSIRHLNPEGLNLMPEIYSQAVTAQGGRLVFLAGQGGYDASGKIARGDYEAQTRQAFRNLCTALAAAGGGPEHVVMSTMYVKDLHPEALEAFARAMSSALDGKAFPPNASTLVGVQGLAYPEMLVEINAIAVVPA